MAQDKKVTANRTYKSSVFTMVFQENANFAKKLH